MRAARGIALAVAVALLTVLGVTASAAPPAAGVCPGLTGDALTRCLYSELDDRLRALEPEQEPTKPDATSTGMRVPVSRTITSAQALTELRATKTLQPGTRVTGGLPLSGSDGIDWKVEDVRVEGGLYTLRGYVSLTPFTGTQAQRPQFTHVDVVGSGAISTSRSSVCVYGQDLIVRNADISGCDDGARPTGRFELHDSWIHDLDKPAGSHCDGIQIRNGTAILIKGNRIDAYVGYSSDSSGGIGDWGSGGLETGSLTGPIEADFIGNWWAGGRFTFRGATDAELPQVDYYARDNRFMRYGTSVALNRTDLPPHQYGPVSENPGDFDDSNVWEDTGEPVR